MISCLIVLLLSILNMEIVLGQEVTSVVNASKASDDYRTREVATDDGYIANIEGGNGYPYLRIPIRYQLQKYELSDGDLGQHRTIRRQRWQCLFRHLLLADFLIYRQ